MYRPAGVFSEDYVDDRRLLRTGWQMAALLVGIGIFVLYPLLASDAWIRFASVTIITAIAVVGLHLLTGLTGQISLGQAAFMGVGAYATAATVSALDLPLPFPLIIGASACAATGLIFGLPAVRTKGFYLALTTLAAQFVFLFTVPRLPRSIFGGSAGIPVSRPSIFGYSLNGRADFYFMVLAVGILMVVAALFIQESKVGRAFIAIRDNEHSAEVTGIPIRYYKVLAFVIAAFYAGVAGGLLAYESRIVHFEQFALFDSIWFLGMLIVGGMGRLLGAALGVFLLQAVEEFVRIGSPQLSEIFPAAGSAVVFPMINVVFGLVILLFLIFQPRGLAELYRRTERRARLWPFPY